MDAANPFLPNSEQPHVRHSKTRTTQANAQKVAAKPPQGPRRAAGMEPRRPLSGDRRPGSRARPRSRRRRHASRSRRATKASSRELVAGRMPARRSPTRSRPTRRSTICSAGSFPTPAWSTPATRPIPQRAKFYGDVQERMTATSTHLLFFALELNRIDDALLEAAMARSRARPLPAVARGHPQGQALPARGPHRAAVPRKVDDRPAAWNRLFDETMARLRFKIDGKTLALEPALNLLQGPNGSNPQSGRQGARRDLQGRTCAPSR